MTGGERHPAEPITTLVIFVRLPDAAIDRAGREIEIHLRQRDGLQFGNALAPFARHKPPATEQVEHFVDGVARGEVGFAKQSDALVGRDDAKALLKRRRLLRFAEHFDRAFTDVDRDKPAGRRAGNDLDFRARHFAEVICKVLDRVAESLALVFSSQTRTAFVSRFDLDFIRRHHPLGGDDGAFRGAVGDEGDVGGHRRNQRADNGQTTKVSFDCGGVHD